MLLNDEARAGTTGSDRLAGINLTLSYVAGSDPLRRSDILDPHRGKAAKGIIIAVVLSIPPAALAALAFRALLS